MYWIINVNNEVNINKIYREKSIPTTGLWCPVVYSVIIADFIMPETKQPTIVIIPFKGPCRTLGL